MQIVHTLSSCPSHSYSRSLSSPHVASVLRSPLTFKPHSLHHTPFSLLAATANRLLDWQLSPSSNNRIYISISPLPQPHHNTSYSLYIYIFHLESTMVRCKCFLSFTQSCLEMNAACGLTRFYFSAASRLHRLPQRLDYTLIPAPLGECLCLMYLYTPVVV